MNSIYVVFCSLPTFLFTYLHIVALGTLYNFDAWYWDIWPDRHFSKAICSLWPYSEFSVRSFTLNDSGSLSDSFFLSRCSVVSGILYLTLMLVKLFPAQISACACCRSFVISFVDGWYCSCFRASRQIARNNNNNNSKRNNSKSKRSVL